METGMNDINRLIRISDVMQLTSLSRAHLWRLMKAGKFPAAVELSSRSRAWRLDEVNAWIERKSAERPAPVSAA